MIDRTYRAGVFLVGAPKCGTTALAQYLSGHEGLDVPAIKEPHFFCTDFPAFRRIRSIDEYHALFRRRKEAGSLGCDASVWYLYSREAIRKIRSYNPDAKIIVMLRDPATMLPSLHNQLVFSGRETITSFDDAWNAVGQRRAGDLLPKHVLEPSHLFYDEVAKYSESLTRVYECFPKDQVEVVIFDEFVADPVGQLKRVLSFLEVDSEYSPTIERHNESRSHRFPKVSSFLQHPPFPLSSIKRALKSMPMIRRGTPMRPVYSLLSQPSVRSEPSAAVRDAIRETYRADVQKLRELTKTDLSGWLA